MGRPRRLGWLGRLRKAGVGARVDARTAGSGGAPGWQFVMVWLSRQGVVVRVGGKMDGGVKEKLTTDHALLSVVYCETEGVGREG